MTAPGVLWVDSDTQHAAAARHWMAARHPGWRVVNTPTAETALAPLASQAWAAVVLCLKPSVHELPGLLELCAGRPVLLCIDAAQEALAARAFRCGLGDYVLRDTEVDGTAHLSELLNRLAALIDNAHGKGQPVRRVDARIWQEALTLLQEQRAALQATLASMSQGIFKTGPDQCITVYNDVCLSCSICPNP